MTSTQAAKKWGVSADKVRRLCEAGKIKGAHRDPNPVWQFRNGPWIIPDDVVLPDITRAKVSQPFDGKFDTPDGNYQRPKYKPAD